MIHNSLFIILFCFLLLWPLATQGAILYLEPSAGSYHLGDTFLVEVRLDTEGQYINAVEVNLNFSSEILEVRNLSQGNSILTLWVKTPSITNIDTKDHEKMISFVGGVPGGYQGSNGLVGKIIFRAHQAPLIPTLSSTKIGFLEGSRVLLNDGKGTQAKLVSKGAIFNILPKRLEVPEDEWQKELEKDKTPPQSFKVEVSQDPAIFKGKYFIIFSTTDKETGIDHYEVREGRRDWKVATSPYVLENQKLTDDIWVKAVDKAGNEWIEIIKAPPKPVWKYILYGVLVLMLLLVIIRLGKMIKKP